MSETWSLEAWAWDRIHSGNVADFNAYFGKTLDPRNPEGWGDNRKLGSGLLRRLFFEPPYRDEMPPEGVRIIGAYLTEGQVLSLVRVSRQVWLDQCRSESQIDFSGTTISGWLSFESSFLGKPADFPSLDLSGTHIEGVVSLKGVIAAGEIELTNAKVDDHLDMSGSSGSQNYGRSCVLPAKNQS